MITTDTHLYFYGSTFSNWAPAYFFDPIAQAEFANAEQGFMFHKARFFNDEAVATKILVTTSPRDVKALGREIRGYNDVAWSCVRYGYMVWVNYLKFVANTTIRNDLVATGNLTLVEASPYDTIWGIGLGEQDPLIYDEKTWKGQNLLGKALMDVRQMINAKA